MYSNYTSSDWFIDMQSLQEFCVSVLPWRLLTFAIMLFAFSVIIALLLCIWRSFTFDIADKDDIIQDRIQCPLSWYCGENYETVNIPKNVLRHRMLCANLSYHTFWNVAVMGRYRICGAPHNKVYFKVNRFSNSPFDPFMYIKRLFTLYSLVFIWGYPLFLVITLLRMSFHKYPLC